MILFRAHSHAHVKVTEFIAIIITINGINQFATLALVKCQWNAQSTNLLLASSSFQIKPGHVRSVQELYQKVAQCKSCGCWSFGIGRNDAISVKVW
jgi:hypothetical protein